MLCDWENNGRFDVTTAIWSLTQWSITYGFSELRVDCNKQPVYLIRNNLPFLLLGYSLMDNERRENADLKERSQVK